MSQQESISQLLSALKRGDADGQQALCERYFQRLTQLAKQRLERIGARRRAADEEDVAISVFESLFRRVEHGQFPQLSSRDDLWRILFTMVDRKSKNQLRHERASKRGSGKVAGESVFEKRTDGDDSPGIEARVEAIEPTGPEIAELSDAIRSAFESLDPEYQRIAELRMQGYTNAEIAEQLGKSVATVERRLRVIRATWEELS